MLGTNNAPTLLQVTKSILAAGFGVQSNENRERDFTYGKPVHFIIMALVLTILFVLSVWGVVKLVMQFAGI